jgi:hypothetical protein
MLLKGVEVPLSLLLAPEQARLIIFAGAGV